MKRFLTAVLLAALLVVSAIVIWMRPFGQTDMAAEIILFAYEERGITSLQGISPSGKERITVVSANPAASWMSDLMWQAPSSVRTIAAINIDLTIPHSPSWMANGRFITYQNHLYSRACDELVWMDVSHKEPTVIACLRRDNLDDMLDWTSDGRYAAFAQRGNKATIIQVLNMAGEQINRYFPGDNVWGLSWSPDATQIAVTMSGVPSLRIYQVDGTAVSLPTDAPAFGKPTWSPDGTALAFFCYAQERIDICVQPTDGTQGQRISFPPKFPYLKYQLQWSPDGARLLFVGQQRGGREDLFVINPDGSDLRPLTTHPASDLQPAWSPDGRQVVFVSSRDGNKELYTVLTDGIGLTRLTNTPGDETNPTWKPPLP